jgi:hypothetical protein
VDSKLIGTWTLASCFMEDVETKEKILAWGEHPNGYLVLTPEGRWIVVQTAENRKIANDDVDRAAAFRSMPAYSGTYKVDADRITIDVDISWDESWVGSRQVRLFKLEGDKLYIEATPQPYANFGGKTMRGILIWERDDGLLSRASAR